jgi:hypothetical protein
MSYTGTQVINWVAAILHDVSNVRWSRALLLDYINLAQVMTVTVQPQANTVYRKMQLQPGALQKMQPDDIQLETITRNMGSDGQTPGPTISMTDRPTMDSQLSTWSTPQAGVSEIQNYIFDERVRDAFYVYPPVPSGTPMWIEYVSAQRPLDLATEDDLLSLVDIYIIQVLRFVLYLCLSFQLDNPSSAQAALHQYQLFNGELGQSISAHDLVNPALQETYLTAQPQTPESPAPTLQRGPRRG